VPISTLSKKGSGLPKKIIKNYVYDFAQDFCTELTGLGFCSVAPFRDRAVQSLLELTDSEIQGLDSSVKSWQLNSDSGGLAYRRFGDSLVFVCPHVRPSNLLCNWEFGPEVPPWLVITGNSAVVQLTVIQLFVCYFR
jgi:hypothetical protein